ncbi:unnamed protein product [Closterium sp. NIES-53]
MHLLSIQGHLTYTLPLLPLLPLLLLLLLAGTNSSLVLVRVAAAASPAAAAAATAATEATATASSESLTWHSSSRIQQESSRPHLSRKLTRHLPTTAPQRQAEDLQQAYASRDAVYGGERKEEYAGSGVVWEEKVGEKRMRVREMGKLPGEGMAGEKMSALHQQQQHEQQQQHSWEQQQQQQQVEQEQKQCPYIPGVLPTCGMHREDETDEEQLLLQLKHQRGLTPQKQQDRENQQDLQQPHQQQPRQQQQRRQSQEQPQQQQQQHEQGKRQLQRRRRLANTTPVTYRGGTMMHRPIRVHVVWYGSAITERFKSAVRLFVSSLAPSADPAVTVPLWWNINRMYYDSDGRNVTANVLDAGKLPISADDIYLLLTDKNTVQSGSKENAGARWCSSYCAWHTFFDYNTTTAAAAAATNVGGSSIVAKIAWVGDPTIYVSCLLLTCAWHTFFDYNTTTTTTTTATTTTTTTTTTTNTTTTNTTTAAAAAAATNVGGSSIPSSIVVKIAWVGDPTIHVSCLLLICPGDKLTFPSKTSLPLTPLLTPHPISLSPPVPLYSNFLHQPLCCNLSTPPLISLPFLQQRPRLVREASLKSTENPPPFPSVSPNSPSLYSPPHLSNVVSPTTSFKLISPCPPLSLYPTPHSSPHSPLLQNLPLHSNRGPDTS